MAFLTTIRANTGDNASYTKAVEAGLEPLGFLRAEEPGSKRDKAWTREVDGFRDYVGLQYSSVAGVTVNLATKDLVSERLLQVVNPDGVYIGYPYERRIGTLMRTTDEWWKNEPDGPERMVRAITTYGPPFFDQFRTLDGQIERYKRGGDPASMLYLAAALFRQGNIEATCASARSESAKAFKPWWPLFERLQVSFGCNPR